MSITTVLHLTDLHFGAEPHSGHAATALAQRENTLDELLNVLAGLRDEWHPQAVVISGDLGWAGRASDYDAAQVWLSRLISCLSLDPSDLVICPGNHDVDRREADVLERPDNPKRADHLLRPEGLELISRPFAAFTRFTQALKIPPLQLGDRENYLVGAREHAGLRFVSLNSAWFCRDTSDRGRLFMGLPQLEVMAATNQLPTPQHYDDLELTVGILHHPQEWLSESELRAYGGRPATFRFFGDRVHIILSGHAHGEIAEPSRIGGSAWAFVGGATYDSTRYWNNFSLLQIDSSDRLLRRQPYEFDPRDQQWHRRRSTTHPLTKRLARRPATLNKIGLPEHVQTLRENARRHAERYVEKKSRAIGQTASLPELLRRRVGLHDPAERLHRHRGELVLPKSDTSIPLESAIKSGRPTFLLGELGSGKSTLVGQLVCDLNSDSSGLLAFLIPAKHFLTWSGPRHSFVNAVADYVAAEIAPYAGTLNLREVLLAGQETTVVVDGFDELGIAAAEALLMAAEDAVELYGRLRVVATGRPVELRALNYGKWQLLETLPMTREEQFALLMAEAHADGLDDDAASADARSRLKILQEHEDLASISETPLVLRLLRPRLEPGTERRTLGDLVIEVLYERLAGWGQREGKEQARSAFAAAFSDGASRAALLRAPFLQIFNHGPQQRPRLRDI